MVWQNGVFGLYNAALVLFDGATSFPLIAIPLFILAGALMNTGGISRRLILIGIDPVHFGIILTLNLAIGQQTPPVASVLVTSCSIARTEIWATTRTNLPFIAVLFALLMVVTYVPIVPMGLVEIFYR